MNDIILNGVSITELKKTKALIQKDASAFIANGLRDARALLDSIVNTDPEEAEEGDVEAADDIAAAAAQAAEILENVNIVSGVSGVDYYLPYGGEYEEKAYSSKLESIVGYTPALDGLYSILEDMESQSRDWHTSTC